MSQQIIAQLGALSRDLDAAIRDMGRLDEAAIEAEGTFKVAKARAFLAAEGSVQAREAQAVIATERERMLYEKSAALVRLQREHIRALHTRIDVGRTITATERALSGVVT